MKYYSVLTSVSKLGLESKSFFLIDFTNEYVLLIRTPSPVFSPAYFPQLSLCSTIMAK